MLFFVFQQPSLLVHAAAVAGQRAVRTDHPVARNHNADRIVVIRSADSPNSFGIANAFRLFAIGDGFPIRNGLQRLLALYAERRAFQANGQGKFHQRTVKIGSKLADGLCQQRRGRRA